MTGHALKAAVAILVALISAPAVRGDDTTDISASTTGRRVSDYLEVDLSIANNHLWRGIEVSDGLVMCSSLGVHDRNGYVKVGVWNGTNVTGKYKELNFFAEFTVRRFRLAFWDTYNFSTDADYNNKEFFNYKAHSTGRFLDCIATYSFGERFPLTLTWSTILFGRDRCSLYAAGSKQRYSTYVSAAYRCLERERWTIDASVGGTFTLANRASDRSTFYSSRPGIIDVRATVTYDIKITDRYNLPVSSTVMFNPVENRAYFQMAAKVFSF